MKTRVIIITIFAALGAIIAAVPQNTTKPYKLTASEMLEEANNRMHYFSPEEVADFIVKKDPEYQLIDVRPQDEFEKFTLPNAIHIPLNDLLNDEYEDILNQEIKYNVLFSNGTISSSQAWMILTQLGWDNNYVMEGGLNYWAEVILNPSPPSNLSPNEEIAKYQFRKAAGEALSGGTAIETESSKEVKAQKPAIKRRPKKQRVEGGC